MDLTFESLGNIFILGTHVENMIFVKSVANHQIATVDNAERSIR